MSPRKIVIGVIGGATAGDKILDLAFETGALIARRDALLVCGGLGGVMEAVSRGAAENGGTVIGILPGDSKDQANPFVSIAIPTGMGIARNVLVVRTADALIAFPGSYGTLSEIALGLNIGKTVVVLPADAWDLRRIGTTTSAAQFKQAIDPAQAVGLALDALR